MTAQLRRTTIGLTTLAMILLAVSFVYAQALPQGEQVAQGTATFDRSTTDTLTVNQSSDRVVINYSSFNVGAQNTVNFVQPSTASVALNRVTGSAAPSEVFGTINANGQIFLINPNGWIFAPGSSVNAAGVCASTLDISDDDFMAGRYNFFKNGVNAFIKNAGSINGRDFVMLLSGAVQNTGVIAADLGRVVLASGEKMTVALDVNNDISVTVDEGVATDVYDNTGKKIDTAINNSGTITGSKVLLTAKVLNKVFDKAINNSGIIQAGSLQNNNGVIELTAEGASVVNSGTIAASQVKINVTGGDFTNTAAGKIRADGNLASINGGLVSIHADSVYHYGTISANAFEGGTAGDITVDAQNTLYIKEGSVTEARVKGDIGNGGRIILNSNGSTFVDRNAVIDISAGLLDGNGGYLEVGAFDQLGFYGILNGRAPPLRTPSTVKFTYHSTSVAPVIITTDLSDYPPSGTPIIYGYGFQPNQTISLNIFGPDGSQAAATVTADAQGCFTYTYTPATLYWGSYFVTGTDGIRSAVATFTDAPKIYLSGTFNGVTGGLVSVTLSWNLIDASSGYKVQQSSDISFPEDSRTVTTTIIDKSQTSCVVTFPTNSANFFRVWAYKLTPGNKDGWVATAASEFSNTVRTLTASATALNKIYDGTTAAEVSVTSADVAPGDNVTFNFTDANFSDQNVGTGKTVTVSGISIGGTDAANYILLNTTVTTTADITARPASVTPNTDSKTYGEVEPALSGTLTGFLAADNVTANYSRTTGETVLGGPYTISATLDSTGSLSNYNITYNTASFTISPKALTITANSTSKPYGQIFTFTGTEFTTSGLVNSDAVTSVTLSSDGTAATAAQGVYDIIPSAAVGTGLNNYTVTYAKGSLTINKGILIITANSTSKTYGQTVTFAGTEFTTSGLADGDTITSVTLNSDGAAATAGVGGYVITPSVAVGTGLTNYTITYNNGALMVTPKALTITADNATKTYGGTLTFAGTEFTSNGLVNGDSISSVTLNSDGAAATAGVGGYVITPSVAVGIGLSNYNITYNNGALTVNPKDLTITANDVAKTYGTTLTFAGTEFTSNGLINGDSVTSVYLYSDGAAADAGAASSPYAIVPSSATGNGLGNYSIHYVNGVLRVNKADARIIVNGYTGVYDGDPHGATGSATGVLDEDLTSLLDLGSSFTNVPGGTAGWTFAGNTNYNPSNGSVPVVISKADVVISVTPYSTTYNGNAQTAAGTATGINDEALSGLDLSGTTHTNAGSYTDTWTFTDTTGNYKDKTGTVADVIGKADPKISITGYGTTYNGDPQTAIGAAIGVKDEPLNGLDLSGTTHTNAGTYNNDPWIFTDSTGNYNNASGTVNDAIGKADATIHVNGYTGTYDGDAHGAAGTATGVKGEDLSAGLNLGSSFTDVPGGSADWTFTGGTNYNDATGSVPVVISKANATINVNGYTGVYDGDPHGATGSATGVKGEDLSSGLNLGASYTDVPGGSADWTFAGGKNYNDASGRAEIIINKADPTINVNGYIGTFDGNSHGATGTATGVKGEDLSSFLNLGASYTAVPGGPADWTFGGNNNYNDASGSVSIIINAAPVPAPGNLHYYDDQLRYKLPYNEQMQPYQVTPIDMLTSSDMMGPVYLYHPLTETDASSFEQEFMLDRNAYQFIDDTINLQGNQGEFFLRLPNLQNDDLDKKKKKAL